MGALHFLGYDQKTIYNEMEAKGITWAIYAGDIPQSRCSSNCGTSLITFTP